MISFISGALNRILCHLQKDHTLTLKFVLKTQTPGFMLINTIVIYIVSNFSSCSYKYKFWRELLKWGKSCWSLQSRGYFLQGSAARNCYSLYISASQWELSNGVVHPKLDGGINAIQGRAPSGGYNGTEETALQPFHTWEEVRCFPSEMPTTRHGSHVELWVGGDEPNWSVAVALACSINRHDTIWCLIVV